MLIIAVEWDQGEQLIVMQKELTDAWIRQTALFPFSVNKTGVF